MISMQADWDQFVCCQMFSHYEQNYSAQYNQKHLIVQI